MSVVIKPEQFQKGVTPVDAAHQSRLDFAIKLMAGKLDVENVEDFAELSRTVAELQDALGDFAANLAWMMRMKGIEDWDIKKHLQNTCPTLACLFRIEAIADARICNDQTLDSQLAAVRELAMQAIEGRMGGEFDNPIYPTQRDREKSQGKRWRERHGK